MPRFRWPPLESIPGLRKRHAERPSLVVVGLGNPGPQYSRTRHNVGFWCIDRLAANHSIDIRRRHRTSLIGEGTIGDTRVVLAKPRTFVNRSGDAVRYLLARYRVSPGDVLIVCDDVALDPGKIRLRPSGSAGGHNGLKSIIEALGTQQFARLRRGDRPAGGRRRSDWIRGGHDVAGRAADRRRRRGICRGGRGRYPRGWHRARDEPVQLTPQRIRHSHRWLDEIDAAVALRRSQLLEPRGQAAANRERSRSSKNRFLSSTVWSDPLTPD